MDRPIRVLIVDDAALMRHRLRSIITAADGLEVVGVAASGAECLAQLSALQPDVITLDVWMPEMDGLDTLRRIMRQRPTPVLMVSSLTEAGAQTTLDALSLGAVDYLTKPSSLSGSAQSFADELLHKLVVAAHARVRSPHVTTLPPGPRTGSEAHPPRPQNAAPQEPPAFPPRTSLPGERADSGGSGGLTRTGVRADMLAHASLGAARPSAFTPIQRSFGAALVVIGSSTGGPQMLDRLFSDLSSRVPAAFLVVQHMPPLFTDSLAARLDRRGGLSVREVEDGEYLAEGLALVARGGEHVTLGPDHRLRLDQSAPVHNVRPSIDRTLFSVADHWKGRCLAVILTGMGTDGTDGARAVGLKGAEVFAQDEGTSIVYGMPRAVAEAGLATAVLPIDRVAPAIEQWIAAGKTAALSVAR